MQGPCLQGQPLKHQLGPAACQTDPTALQHEKIDYINQLRLREYQSSALQQLEMKVTLASNLPSRAISGVQLLPFLLVTTALANGCLDERALYSRLSCTLSSNKLLATDRSTHLQQRTNSNSNFHIRRSISKCTPQSEKKGSKCRILGTHTSNRNKVRIRNGAAQGHSCFIYSFLDIFQEAECPFQPFILWPVQLCAALQQNQTGRQHPKHFLQDMNRSPLQHRTL